MKKQKERIEIRRESPSQFGLYVNGHLDILSPRRKILEAMKKDEYKT